ncbi:hypothetical protein EON66_06315 [archaeon]|nr:MAG: hypothetical protein EON66_06315 [archaeon]
MDVLPLLATLPSPAPCQCNAQGYTWSWLLLAVMRRPESKLQARGEWTDNAAHRCSRSPPLLARQVQPVHAPCPLLSHNTT